MKQYHVDYYQKNSDKIKKKQINDYYSNIAKFKGYHNKYYQKNKIRINEVNKKTRKLNKKKLLDEFILKIKEFGAERKWKFMIVLPFIMNLIC